MIGLVMVLRVASLCMYLLVRIALRSSLRWARATYSGLVATILPFISVTAFVASSGEEKQTKPKPLLWDPSVITYRKQRSWSSEMFQILDTKPTSKDQICVSWTKLNHAFTKLFFQGSTLAFDFAISMVICEFVQTQPLLFDQLSNMEMSQYQMEALFSHIFIHFVPNCDCLHGTKLCCGYGLSSFYRAMVNLSTVKISKYQLLTATFQEHRQLRLLYVKDILCASLLSILLGTPLIDTGIYSNTHTHTHIS